MFTPLVLVLAVSFSIQGGVVPSKEPIVKAQQSIVDTGFGGGGNPSGMIELCSARIMSGNTCFYQNLFF